MPKIQLPYTNNFETILEYKNAFLRRQIDFYSFIGPTCPICNSLDCYQQITPYFRYAIDIFDGFQKTRVPIGRFLCQNHGLTFSLLPIELIPYVQYTLSAVICSLLLGLRYWNKGQRGFYGASLSVEPDSNVSPWLVYAWLMMVHRGFRRGHSVLSLLYDLSAMSTSQSAEPWQEVSGYFWVLGWQPDVVFHAVPIRDVVTAYGLKSKLFLFGTSSQQRALLRH